MTPALRPAQAADVAAIVALLRQAFDGDAEATLVAALRAEGAVVAELVAEGIAGHVMFTCAPVDDTPVVALAPLAVAASARRQGLGAALVIAGLERCAEAGAAAALVLGDPAYYARFGFHRAEGITGAPWCDHPAFQVLSLRPDQPPPRGRVRYAEAFGVA